MAHAATDGDADGVALAAGVAGDELAGCAGVAEAAWPLAELPVDAQPAASAAAHSRAAAAPARRAAGADGVMGGIPLSQRAT